MSGRSASRAAVRVECRIPGPAGVGRLTLCFVLAGILSSAPASPASAQSGPLRQRVPSVDRILFQAGGSDTTRTVSSGGAMLRSAVLPGWGQAYVGHPWKGLWMAGAAGTFVYLTLRADAEVADLAARRPEVTDPVLRAALEADIEKWRVERRRWMVWSATLWIYSVVDAYVDAQLHDFDTTEPRFGLALAPPPSGGGAGMLVLTLGFSLGHH